jgi:hypothetical protein
LTDGKTPEPNRPNTHPERRTSLRTLRVRRLASRVGCKNSVLPANRPDQRCERNFGTPQGAKTQVGRSQPADLQAEPNKRTPQRLECGRAGSVRVTDCSSVRAGAATFVVSSRFVRARSSSRAEHGVMRTEPCSPPML